MKGIGDLMKQAQEMQSKLAEAQEKMAAIEVQGESGAGMVKVTMNCRYEVKRVEIDAGLLSEDKELRRLARSYLVADLPYPAAHVLEQGIDGGQIEAEPKALELLANSWIQAREFDRSLPPLVRAAEIAEDGNVFVRLGQVYLQGEAWREAADAFKNAIDKGELKKPGNAHLLLGIAYYNDAQSFRAKSSFIDALDFEATRTQAEQWIAHLEREAKTS